MNMKAYWFILPRFLMVLAAMSAGSMGTTLDKIVVSEIKVG